MELTDLVREIRGSMSLAEFGRKIGLTHAAISQYENGTRIPPIKVLKRMADATGKELIIEFRDPEGSNKQLKLDLDNLDSKPKKSGINN